MWHKLGANIPLMLRQAIAWAGHQKSTVREGEEAVGRSVEYWSDQFCACGHNCSVDDDENSLGKNFMHVISAKLSQLWCWFEGYRSSNVSTWLQLKPTHTVVWLYCYQTSLLKNILKSRLFVGRSRLSDSWIQENVMGPFERRRSNISRRRLSEPMTAWFWEGCQTRVVVWYWILGKFFSCSHTHWVHSSSPGYRL